MRNNYRKIYPIRLALCVVALMAVCFAAAPACAQKPETQAEVIARIEKVSAKTQTLSCTFVQQKSVKMLGQKLVSKGVMLFGAPDRLRWEYTSPYKYAFILNGPRVKLINSSRSDVIDTDKNKTFREIARLIMNSVTGRALSGKKDFKTTVAKSADHYYVTLVPKRRNTAAMFAKIVLAFDKKSLLVNKITIYEKNGDTTVINLSNLKRDVTLPESTFAVD